MKIRDFAQSRLDQMSIPVRFTEEDLAKIGGGFERKGDERATIHLPPKFDRKKLTDEETVALFDLAERITRDFERGVSFYREAARFRELAGIGIIPSGPEIQEIEKTGWFTEVVSQPWFSKRPEASRKDADVTMSAIMTWVSARLRAVSHTSNWFVPSDSLVYQLLATDLRGVVVGDLKLPVPAFYLELPEGIFCLDREGTGWHSIRYLVVTEGEITECTREAHAQLGLPVPALGRRLLVEMYGATNAKSTSPFDDVWAFHSYRISDPMADLDQAISDSLNDPEEERTFLRGKIGDRRLDGMEIRREVLKFLMNFCIYLASSEAKVEHYYQEEIDRLTKTKGADPKKLRKEVKKLRKNVQDRVQALLRSRIFRVGSDVTVTKEVQDYVLSDESGAGHKLAYRTIVRGHWRNQAHGPKRSLRTQKWIAPHVRGADLPTPVVGHNYEVR